MSVYGSLPSGGLPLCDGVQFEDASHRGDSFQPAELERIEHRADERGWDGIDVRRAVG